MKKIGLIITLLLTPMFIAPVALAATQPYTSGSGNWTSPVTATVTIELHGGGGGGGYGGGANGNGGGGGAGGQVSVSTVSVTKGNSYSYSVGSLGAGGTSTTPDGGVGGDTTLVVGATTYTAKGGDYGRSYANGSAGGTGSLSGGVGGTVYAGGSGGAGSASNSGGGGGGAGTTGTGQDATGSPPITGGAATSSNGGAGGDGSTGNRVAGSPGGTYGGAGGGGTRASNGGDGAGGYVLITYPDNTPPTVILNTPADPYSTTNTTPAFTFTGTDATYFDSIEYNIQIATDNTFATLTLDKVSSIDTTYFTAGHPYASGSTVTFTVQPADALSPGTYFWHVRGIDPGGTNTYGSWSETRSFSVTGALDHYLVTAASPQTAGVCSTGTNTVTAKDASNNTVGSDASTVNMTYSGTGITFYTAADCSTQTTSYTLTSGVTTIYYKTNRAQGFTITATKNLSTETGTSSSITVNPGSQSRLVITLPGQTFTAGTGNSGTVNHQTVGNQFTITSITATDDYFNIVTGYAGNKTLNYSGPTGSPSYTTSVNFASGASTTPLLTTLQTAETVSITVTDTGQFGYASSVLTVDPPVTPTPTPMNTNINIGGGTKIKGGTKLH